MIKTVITCMVALALSGSVYAEESVKTTVAPAPKLSPSEQEIFLRQLSDTLSTIKTINVRFVQERHLVLFLDRLVSGGICCFQEPVFEIKGSGLAGT